MLDAMPNANTYLWGAALALLLGFWQKVKNALGYVRNVAIPCATITDTGYVNVAVLAHLARTYKMFSFAPRTYAAGFTHVRSRQRTELVPYYYTRGWCLLLVGRWPVLLHTSNSAVDFNIDMYYLRGTVDVDAILYDGATDTYTRLIGRMADDMAVNRFCVQRFNGRSKLDVFARNNSNGGSGQNDSVSNGPSVARAAPSQSDGANRLTSPWLRQVVTPLGYAIDDLAAGSNLAGAALDRLALSDGCLHAISDIKRWYAAREWYAERDIPWRYGIVLHGKPGNGKTATVRALAQDLNIPIAAFDLASMTNHDFLAAWYDRVRPLAPCIALFEDIDTVFEGRKNVSGMEDGLTFDCFLNALGGVDTPEGMLTVITTNRPEVMDGALANIPVPKYPQSAQPLSRPGRIEAVVELGLPDEAGRRKIAERILVGHDRAIAKVVSDGKYDSGAQFLDRCRLVALAHYWDKPTISIEEAA